MNYLIIDEAVNAQGGRQKAKAFSFFERDERVERGQISYTLSYCQYRVREEGLF
jgi:hypothetical protein